MVSVVKDKYLESDRPPTDIKQAASSVFRLLLRLRRALLLVCLVYGIVLFNSFLSKSDKRSDFDVSLESGPPSSLSRSLIASGRTGTLFRSHRNVVFLLNDLGVASQQLLDLACELHQHNRVVTHVLVTGESTVPIESFRQANDLETDCKVFVHDGRSDRLPLEGLGPDTPEFTTLQKAHRYHRFKEALRESLRRLRPHVVFFHRDDQVPEFQTMIEEVSRNVDAMTLIGLSSKNLQSAGWISELEIPALKAWNEDQIDIVIHDNGHRGDLERVLRSLQHADYIQSSYPRLRILLHNTGSLEASQLINDIDWPKNLVYVERSNRQQTGLESLWYPTDDHNYAIHIYDTRIELSPLFFHWLKFAILKFRHRESLPWSMSNTLMGVSLSSGQMVSNVPRLTNSLNGSDAVLFFPQHFREFNQYCTLRQMGQNKIVLDHAMPSDIGSESFDRYMDEFLFVRPYTLLETLPLEDRLSFVIRHHEHEGLHSSVAQNGVTLSEDGDLIDSSAILKQIATAMPRFPDLELVHRNGSKIHLEDLIRETVDRRVSACAPNLFEYDARDLFCEDEATVGMES